MIVTRSAEETEAVAARLAVGMRAGDVVTLHGDLGAGKTTFARGILRALGYRGRVASPTYTLAARYEIPRSPQPIVVYHFDAYFSEKESQFLSEGGAELIGGDNISLIEWPERMSDFLPAARLEVFISEGAAEDERNITFHGTAPREQELAARAGREVDVPSETIA